LELFTSFIEKEKSRTSAKKFNPRLWK